MSTVSIQPYCTLTTKPVGCILVSMLSLRRLRDKNNVWVINLCLDHYMYPSGVSSSPDLDIIPSVFSTFAFALETLSRACNVFDDVYHDSKLSTRLFVLYGRFMVKLTPHTNQISNLSSSQYREKQKSWVRMGIHPSIYERYWVTSPLFLPKKQWTRNPQRPRLENVYSAC